MLGASGASWSNSAGSTGARERAQALAQVGREPLGEALELIDVAGDDIEHVRAETQGVLERVKAFEHRQRGVPARAAVAGDQ